MKNTLIVGLFNINPGAAYVRASLNVYAEYSNCIYLERGFMRNINHINEERL